jgi:hypothetical protein
MSINEILFVAPKKKIFSFVNGANQEKSFLSLLMPFFAALRSISSVVCACNDDEFLHLAFRCRLNDFMQSIVPSSISNRFCFFTFSYRGRRRREWDDC